MDEQDQIPPWTLGWRLQRALSWAGMTTEEMSYELGVARSTISRWCNDKGHPTRGYLKLWAQRTKVPLVWLTEGDLQLPRVDSNHQPADMNTDLEPFLNDARIAAGEPGYCPTDHDLHVFRKAVPITPSGIHHSLNGSPDRAIAP